MRIGLDFDNTIVCYDEAFYTLALEGQSIPANLPRTKEHVKAHLQAQGRNDYWTELQGLAYGPRMESASTFPGFEKFLSDVLSATKAEVFIVSHRSPKPYSGLDCDLHAAARTWLSRRPWIQNQQILMKNIYFESTKKEKIQRIAELKLDVFVDDLVEIFTDPAFPPLQNKIHFRPSGKGASDAGLIPVKGWDDILKKIKTP